MSNWTSTSSTRVEAAADAVWSALRRCPPLTLASPRRDELRLAVRDAVCTRNAARVTPLGSSAEVRIGREHATSELLCAMEWLYAHEAAARALARTELFVKLRGIATRGANGSARLTQADALHGLTDVPAGQRVDWFSLDWESDS